MRPFNIMEQLTPIPPFDPARKNSLVAFTIPTKSVALRATEVKIMAGINRTKK